MDDNATPALPEDPDATPNGGEALPPELTEPEGPLPELLQVASAEVKATVTGDSEAEALLAEMGVEEEGFASGQLVGVMVAVLASVAALAFALIYLFILPLQQRTADEASVRAEYPELADNRAKGLDQLNKYRTVDGGYGIPIERAMAVIAAEYDSTTGAEATTRQEFNTAWIDLNPDGAVRTAGGREALSAAPANAEDAPAETEDAEVQDADTESIE